MELLYAYVGLSGMKMSVVAAKPVDLFADYLKHYMYCYSLGYYSWNSGNVLLLYVVPCFMVPRINTRGEKRPNNGPYSKTSCTSECHKLYVLRL